MSTAKIKNEFNRRAESLGCRARLSGNKNKPKFQEFTGQYDSKGFEIVIGIDANRFSQLISKFPQLH